MAMYKCKHCGKTVERNSHAKRIKSYCDTTGKSVFLIRVEDADNT